MATLTVYPAIDSRMHQPDPDTNYGTNISIIHGIIIVGEEKSEYHRGIGNFDVSALTGKTINSAKLVRVLSNVIGGGVDAKISRCTRPSTWTEGGATWNDYDGGAWTSAGGDYDDAGGGGAPAAITYTEPSGTGEHEVTGLLTFVTDALASRGGIVSIITRIVDEDAASSHRFIWRSKDYGSDIWHLVIDYTPDAQPERPPLRGVMRGVMRGA